MPTFLSAVFPSFSRSSDAAVKPMVASVQDRMPLPLPANAMEHERLNFCMEHLQLASEMMMVQRPDYQVAVPCLESAARELPKLSSTDKSDSSNGLLEPTRSRRSGSTASTASKSSQTSTSSGLDLIRLGRRVTTGSSNTQHKPFNELLKLIEAKHATGKTKSDFVTPQDLEAIRRTKMLPVLTILLADFDSYKPKRQKQILYVLSGLYMHVAPYYAQKIDAAMNSVELSAELAARVNEARRVGLNGNGSHASVENMPE